MSRDKMAYSQEHNKYLNRIKSLGNGDKFEELNRIMAEIKTDEEKLRKKKFGNPYSYLRSLVQDDLTVKLGGTTINVAPPQSNTTQPEGGSQTGGNSGDNGSDENDPNKFM